MAMNSEELKKRVLAAVEEYIADEEAFDDNAQLCISPEGEVEVRDSADVPDGDDGNDYYDVMEFVRMSAAEPGKWEVDAAAIDALAEA